MKVLIIEDNPDHFEIIEDAFDTITEMQVDVIQSGSLRSGAALLASEHFDICLCDLQLPDSTIEETVQWLSLQTNPLPMVTLTSLNSLQTAQKLLKMGVQDYLSKDELTPQLLYKTCQYAIERFRHQQLITEKNKNMQSFCVSLSHDFSGHINRILGVSQILKSEISSRTICTPKELTLFEYLETSTTGIHKLVSALQSYLTVEYVNQVFETVDLTSVVETVVISLKNALQVKFEVNMPNELATISGNTALLQLLFQNLISNSIKFNHGKPVIDISAKDNGNYVEISLQDNGIGFDPVHAQKIFTPFSRLVSNDDFSGTGLGLSIVKRVIEHHHGSIEAFSEPGKGSQFILKLKKSAMK